MKYEKIFGYISLNILFVLVGLFMLYDALNVQEIILVGYSFVPLTFGFCFLLFAFEEVKKQEAKG